MKASTATSPTGARTGATSDRQACAGLPAAAMKLAARRHGADEDEDTASGSVAVAKAARIAGQQPAAALEGEDAAGGERDHDPLGIDDREDDRAREEAEQQPRPGGPPLSPHQPAARRCTRTVAISPPTTGDDHPGDDRGVPRVQARSRGQPSGCADQPDQQRVEGEEAERRLGVQRVVRIAPSVASARYQPPSQFWNSWYQRVMAERHLDDGEGEQEQAGGEIDEKGEADLMQRREEPGRRSAGAAIPGLRPGPMPDRRWSASATPIRWRRVSSSGADRRRRQGRDRHLRRSLWRGSRAAPGWPDH